MSCGRGACGPTWWTLRAIVWMLRARLWMLRATRAPVRGVAFAPSPLGVQYSSTAQHSTAQHSNTTHMNTHEHTHSTFAARMHSKVANASSGSAARLAAAMRAGS
eukprot:1175798-Prorocentrum_minimum.AAC.1